MRAELEKRKARSGPCRWIALWLMLIVPLVSLWPAAGAAQDVAVSEAEAKAAFLYNFAKFVEWPAKAFTSDSEPISVAVFGDDQFAVKLSALLQQRKAHGRSFHVRKAFSVQEAKEAHIAFISSEENKRVAQILDGINNSPTLTVGESEPFFEHGGMINFVVEDKKLRFDINVGAAEKASLNVSSQLLRLARKLKERPGK